jgi:predicted dehydrogenase
MLSNIYVEGGPFSESAWRREWGALWDIGPHALSLLWPVLGQVTGVVAGAGVADHVHLILRHVGGTSSTVSVSLTTPLAATGRTVYVEGEAGREMLPPPIPGDERVLRAHGAALDALMAQIASPSRSHACDVHLGARVVEVLDAAQRSLASGCWVNVPPPDVEARRARA